jgi:hypothetical protein
LKSFSIAEETVDELGHVTSSTVPQDDIKVQDLLQKMGKKKRLAFRTTAANEVQSNKERKRERPYSCSCPFLFCRHYCFLEKRTMAMKRWHGVTI